MDTDEDSLIANLPDRQFRWHPLLGQWVIISAATSKRPWSGAVSEAVSAQVPEHDPDCYLCPGVTRSTGIDNPDYEGPYAFDNDFPSLIGDSWNAPDPDSDQSSNDRGNDSFDELQLGMPSAGQCRVLCWNHRHDHTISDLSAKQMQQVARLWQTEHQRLSGLNHVAQVVIFENKGVETGTSNLHPHGQIYALPFVSDNASRMRVNQAEFYNKQCSAGKSGDNISLLPQLVARTEYQVSHPHSLLIEDGQYFKTVVPWFARFAYESWIVPKQRVADLDAMNPQQLNELGKLYQTQCQRYDRLFARKSPNITLFHNAPCDDHKDNKHCCFFLAMQPPLRAPDMLKFLAGFESGAGNIVNPVIPEIAAHRLRACSLT